MENLIAKTDNNSINSCAAYSEYIKIYEKISKLTPEQAAKKLGVAAENARLLLPFAIIYKRFLEIMEAETIWAPNRDLGDGIAYDYAERKQLICSEHNFEYDIIASAKNMAKRYMAGKNHINVMEELAGSLFDATKKVHGLSKRERLLLRIAVILCDCGKYISISRSSDCAYNIIMATEIIGLSHREREMVAHVVRFHTEEFEYMHQFSSHASLGEQDYLVIAKLTAMLRLVAAMDYSNKQKFRNAKFAVREKQLVISVASNDDMMLEKARIRDNAEFFEEVLGILPVVKQKKSI